MFVDEALKDNLFKHIFKIVKDVEDVVLVGSPGRELLCDGDVALDVDEGMEHVGQKRNRRRVGRIAFRDCHAKLKHTRAIEPFVYKYHAVPY